MAHPGDLDPAVKAYAAKKGFKINEVDPAVVTELNYTRSLMNHPKVIKLQETLMEQPKKAAQQPSSAVKHVRKTKENSALDNMFTYRNSIKADQL